MFPWQLLSGIFLGWGLGSNDAANVFGTAVSSSMVRWRTAALLIAVFALIGALLQGGEGLATYDKLSAQDLTSAFAVCLAAALTVAVMTTAKLPVSTSQAVVGGILGISVARLKLGLMTQEELNLASLTKVVICWVGTPIGAAILAMILFPLIGRVIRHFNPHFLVYDRLMRTLLIAAGIYGAYALGANNVANVTGVFFGAGAFGDPNGSQAELLALLIGGLSIGFGSLTYSRQVMLTVGRSIIPLDAFSAFIVVLSEAITVHIYAEIGVPVSTSQAVVGAVLGIGLLKGMRTVSFSTVGKIFLGWLITPLVALGASFALWMALR
ncbi:MAG: inorganic phosphate transporter [Planctomycetota bacterium]|jgi:PiT family inorganic phosphate transporter